MGGRERDGEEQGTGRKGWGRAENREEKKKRDGEEEG